MARVKVRQAAAGALAGLGGCAVELRAFDAAKGCWEVSVRGASDATATAMPACLEVVDGAEELEALRHRDVLVDGDCGCSGLGGRCGSFQAGAGCWIVELDDGVSTPLPSGVLRGARTGLRMRDPVAIGEWPGHEGQRALFAAEDCPAGRVLFQERPLVVIPVPDDCSWQVFCLKGVEEFLQLPGPQQELLLDLHAEEQFSMYSLRARTLAMASRDFRDPDTERHVLGKEMVFASTGLDKVLRDVDQAAAAWKFLRVMQANGIDFDGFNAVFPVLSHMNHSCEPNVSCLDHEDGKVLVAIRDIREGEQLTISYLGETQLLEPAALRRRYLAHWGFACHCSRCTTPREPLRAFLCPEGCGGSCVADGEDSLMACGRCGCAVGADEVRCMLEAEGAIVNAVLQVERNSRLLGQEPECLAELQEQADELLSPLHWASARLHSLGCDHHRQELELEAAQAHAALELHFLRSQMPWPNAHTAFVCHAHGDLLLAMGRWAEGFAAYVDSLRQLQRVLPVDSRLCEAVRRKLRRTVDGPRPEAQQEL